MCAPVSPMPGAARPWIVEAAGEVRFADTEILARNWSKNRSPLARPKAARKAEIEG
jgi:hypothetical protein